MMRTVPALVAGLLLVTGCDQTGPSPSAAPAPAPPEVPATPVPATRSAVAFVDAAGISAAILGCTPDELRIVVPGFRPIASEDRLSLGTAEQAFALVADLAAPGPGVTAAGAMDPDLLDRLARGEALSAIYGQQSVGPLTAASPAELEAAVSACRRQE